MDPVMGVDHSKTEDVAETETPGAGIMEAWVDLGVVVLAGIIACVVVAVVVVIVAVKVGPGPVKDVEAEEVHIIMDLIKIIPLELTADTERSLSRPLLR